MNRTCRTLGAAAIAGLLASALVADGARAEDDHRHHARKSHDAFHDDLDYTWERRERLRRLHGGVHHGRHHRAFRHKDRFRHRRYDKHPFGHRSLGHKVYRHGGLRDKHWKKRKLRKLHRRRRH